MGKAADIWYPETGLIDPASHSFANGRTKVKLHLASNDAVFVVVRNNMNKFSLELA